METINPPGVPLSSIPSVGCDALPSTRLRRKTRRERNPLQVFTQGGPRKGPKYEALRVQQWVAWITGQRDWVQVQTIARSVGMPSDRLLAHVRKLGIPRRYDTRKRALISLSSLPAILDHIVYQPSRDATTTRYGNGRPKLPSRVRFIQQSRSQLHDSIVD